MLSLRRPRFARTRVDSKIPIPLTRIEQWAENGRNSWFAVLEGFECGGC